jgi:hypothetical protein
MYHTLGNRNCVYQCYYWKRQHILNERQDMINLNDAVTWKNLTGLEQSRQIS